MFARKPREELSPEMRRVRDRATKESWPINDDRADYPAAQQYRQSRAAGAAQGRRAA